MLKYLTAGESHGPMLTVIVDGMPAGMTLDIDRLNFQMSRRQKGYGRGGRMKIERDQVEIVSGVRSSVTMGGPVSFLIHNRDWENWTQIMHPLTPIREDLGLKEKRLAFETTAPRPGHADLPGAIKWNHHDMRNVLERASARETAARVAAGSLARQFLEHYEINIASHVVSIGDVHLGDTYDTTNIDSLIAVSEASEVRCIDTDVETAMIEAIRAAKKKRDSLGGVAEIIIRGLPVGLGGFSQWSDRLDGRLAQAMMSVQSAKGVEIGGGFRSAGSLGSAVHDEIFYDPSGDRRKKKFYRRTNNAGGLEGGITNGEDLVIRVAAKPISTLNQPLQTVDVVTKKPKEAMVERTDNCVVPAFGVVCEAMAALVLADAFMHKFGHDNIEEITRNFEAWLNTEY